MRHGAKPIYGRVGDWRKKFKIDTFLLTQKIIGAKFGGGDGGSGGSLGRGGVSKFATMLVLSHNSFWRNNRLKSFSPQKNDATLFYLRKAHWR